jgi:SAM-dependent methyltransferase/CheY-like chemotaxis protein
MAQPASLTFLLANERAEEIKLATISMRGFYPGCRVEAVYSVDEALDYAAKQDWDVILVDEHLSGRSGFDIVPELRRRASTASIIVQAETYDTPVILHALQIGADHCICKKSPAFLTDLPLAMKQMLDKRDLRLGLGVALERYCRLIESLDGTVYELDAHGRFVSVSPSVSALLGCQPDEMIGAHYTTIIHPDGWQHARYRFNERRTAARATRNFAVKLVMKQWPQEEAALVDAELTATGLYAHHAFMGTIGLLRSTRGHPQATTALQASSLSPQYLERLLKIEQSLPPLAAELAQPLHEILRATEALLKQGQPLQTADLQKIARQAVRAAESAKLLSALIQPIETGTSASVQAGSGPKIAEQLPRASSPYPASGTSEPGAPSISDKPKAPPIERRKSPRVDLLAEASLKTDQAACQGVALNISLGGLYMILNEQIAASENQFIHVGLVSGPAILEIRGMIREIRHATGREESAALAHQTGLAIEFQVFDSPEEMILASLIDELRERSISITVTASLSPEGSRDLRFHAESVAASDDWSPTKQAMGGLGVNQESACLSSPSDYWRLLTHIQHLVGNLENDERILDAGCGNGAFAAFLLIQQAYQMRINSGMNNPRTHYVGIDFPDIPAHSKPVLDIMAAELRGYILATGMSPHLLNTSFCSADLNRTLPFRNNQFDRIVCNMVIGYLRDPLGFLHELMRVLAPNGMLVLTSLNPQAEVPIRFSDPLHHAWELGEAGTTEWLWGSLVHLDKIEREGLLRSPEKQELMALVTSCGAIQPFIYSICADHAYIVVAGKRERTT